ncbi:MAG: hypothetical protein AAF657_20910 [Acidobacteriota bacterium]
MRIAYFISAHGFGHAARACGVIDALWRQAPETEFELLTTAPDWFFEQSLDRAVTAHPVATDLGLIQASSLEEDLDETIHQLRSWVPFGNERLDPLARLVTTMGCDLVLCDIAPIGLAVAARCGLPSVLIENFTWDWIYRGYLAQKPELAEIADELEKAFHSARLRIQTEPLCQPIRGATRVGPISRPPRLDRATVRRRLGIPEEASLVMVTMGGIEWDYAGIEERLAKTPARSGRERWLVVPGASRTIEHHHRAVLLPHRSDFYHPDLVLAADAVIGKLGYSTVAEVHRAGVPFGYVPRPTFPESPRLEAWVRRHLPHHRIDPRAFAAWQWLDEIEPLLEQPRQNTGEAEGGEAAAAQILERLG